LAPADAQRSGDLFTEAQNPPQRWAQVALAMPMDETFTYRVPADMALDYGDFVQVPFGPHSRIGVVWAVEPARDAAPNYRLRDIAERYDCPGLSDALRKLVAWTSAYYLSNLGAVLRMCLHQPGIETPLPRIIHYAPAPEALAAPRLSAQRKTLLSAFASGELTRAEALEQSGVSPAVFKAALDSGLLVERGSQEQRPVSAPDPGFAPPAFRDDQRHALAALREACASGFQVSLLDGVTGSGKTLVYFGLIADAIQTGQSVLVLLPEIALSAQWLEQFKQRFGVAPAIWHSSLTPSQRRQTWRAVAEGKVQVLVGARSALFLPFPSLGLIVVDEEHEAAFKQDEGTRYHARDVAVMRAKLEDCPVLLCSATPSLETLVNAKRGRYRHVVLDRRHSEARPLTISAIDLRQNKPEKGQWLAEPLRQALQETLEAGEQSLLFLNRRGFAPLTLCQTCGHRITCDFCSSWLVLHRFRQMLSCHHCGLSKPLPPTCPECGADDTLVPCGPGVERVGEEVAALFPTARLEIVSSDLLMTSQSVEDFIARMTQGEIDILIGTQMVAKGYNFPNLTTVGIVDADLGLNGGDPRASERSFQLIYQVAGRAGRFEKPGQVFLQSYEPEHPVLAALVAADREAFYAAEIEQRELAKLPPFGRLAIVILSDPDERQLQGFCRMLADRFPACEGVQLLGPAPAPIAQVRGRFRYRFVLKSGLEQRLQELLTRWLGPVKLPNSTRLGVDIDPMSFV
jgi:primosomal protein N' (replication factor Y)